MKSMDMSRILGCFAKKITFDYPKDFADNLIPREGSQ